MENWVSKQRNDTMPSSCCSIYLVKLECDVTLKAPMSMVVMPAEHFVSGFSGWRKTMLWLDRTIERLLEVDLIGFHDSCSCDNG